MYVLRTLRIMLPWEQGKAGRKSALSLEGKKDGGRWVGAADATESIAIRETRELKEEIFRIPECAY